ncbi:MAG: hypothetical protein R3211_09235 [Balneolaceae bacterium]|nr:hypothetical protein [Balneolaceae bacterium]
MNAFNDPLKFVAAPVLLIVLFLATGCFGPKELIDPYYSLHGLADAGKLRYDGFLIGIEKQSRERIQAPLEGYPGISFPDTISGISRVEQNWRRRDFRSLTDDPKALYVTHVMQYDRTDGADPDRVKVSAVFNAYRDHHLPPFSASSRSYTLLDSAMTEKLKRGHENDNPFTHILVFSMGWNTDQYQAVNRINRITDSLTAVSRNDPGTAFRPMVVALTWPSVWLKGSESEAIRSLGHISSYFNKANDADEIGYSIANKLIHQVILPKKQLEVRRTPLQVVLVGHSLGARLLSRAVFSRMLLDDGGDHPGQHVDLFVGLQPAFSANRFIDGKGGEGSPYALFHQMNTAFAFTTSVHDRANQKAIIAFGSLNLGSELGLNAAREHPEIFHILKWSGPSDAEAIRRAGRSMKEQEKNRILLLDASDIITDGSSRKPSGEYASAHNDIYDEEMAELLWQLIKSFAAPD